MNPVSSKWLEIAIVGDDDRESDGDKEIDGKLDGEPMADRVELKFDGIIEDEGAIDGLGVETAEGVELGVLESTIVGRNEGDMLGILDGDAEVDGGGDVEGGIEFDGVFDGDHVSARETPWNPENSEQTKINKTNWFFVCWHV